MHVKSMPVYEWAPSMSSATTLHYGVSFAWVCGMFARILGEYTELRGSNPGKLGLHVSKSKIVRCTSSNYRGKSQMGMKSKASSQPRKSSKRHIRQRLVNALPGYPPSSYLSASIIGRPATPTTTRNNPHSQSSDARCSPPRYQPVQPVT